MKVVLIGIEVCLLTITCNIGVATYVISSYLGYIHRDLRDLVNEVNDLKFRV